MVCGMVGAGGGRRWLPSGHLPNKWAAVGVVAAVDGQRAGACPGRGERGEVAAEDARRETSREATTRGFRGGPHPEAAATEDR